jgi:predicted adenine nucleotide alpha hydrolase (AANH) superfamily ATPase
MKKVLLHICCGVCALHCINCLKEDGLYVEGFYFNPNIHPESEYQKRKTVVEQLKEICSIKINEGKYKNDDWFASCRAYSDEPEGGRRCLLCYRMRLAETLNIARKLNFNYITTTLTISPHKSSKEIITLGKELAGDIFLDADFKKQDGFKKTTELAKKYNFYRQNYCGCVYSFRSQIPDDRSQKIEDRRQKS